ncbi:MAG: glycosyltransferase [Sulfurovaceae bacterium]|nr:glycosyltransferase [Sulfurovaceae bacterium]
MKVAVIHDWLVTNAGAEKVLRAIVECYPNADIFSLVDFLDNTQRQEVILGKNVQTSFIQKLPFSPKYFRNYLPLFPKAIESFDLSGYELIISSSWAVAKGVKKSENQIHICYSHTPIRYAWDLYDEYTSNLSGIKKLLVIGTLRYLRRWDIATLDRVDHFIANSTFVAKRIEKTYKRDALVIHPPIDTQQFKLHEEKEDFYLCASRLVPYKKTKLIVEAFNLMPDKKLVVIGKGEEYEEIKAIANSNIKVLGFQSDEVLKEHMQRAKGFIYMALEDFGIIPVEAMACGTPVIGYGKGGLRDSVIEGKSGIFFKEQTTKSLKEAIERFEALEFNPQKISAHAKKFSKGRFIEEFQEFVERKTSL